MKWKPYLENENVEKHYLAHKKELAKQKIDEAYDKIESRKKERDEALEILTPKFEELEKRQEELEKEFEERRKKLTEEEDRLVNDYNKIVETYNNKISDADVEYRKALKEYLAEYGEYSNKTIYKDKDAIIKFRDLLSDFDFLDFLLD